MISAGMILAIARLARVSVLLAIFEMVAETTTLFRSSEVDKQQRRQQRRQ